MLGAVLSGMIRKDGSYPADKAYDDDWLREQMARLGLLLVAKHSYNRMKPATSDGRREHRLKRPWNVERTNAWLYSYRRAMTRYEKTTRN